MALFKLSDDIVRKAIKVREVAMGLHVVEVVEKYNEIGYVLGDLVLMVPDEEANAQISELLREPWMQSNAPNWHETSGPTDGIQRWNRESQFEIWRDSLEKAPKIERFLSRADVLQMPLAILGPPPAPGKIYGHLPYETKTGANDVFYRCEPWPISKRIHQASKTIDVGTYAMPALELPFVPSGFSAVGRFALRNLAPACFRWELQPVVNSKIRCGASVPLYGQAGGGVEVCFDDDPTRNRGPIANPVVLPPL